MQIRISPEALRNAANVQSQLLDDIAQDTTKLDSLKNQLAQVWKGASGNSVQNALEEIQTTVEKTVDTAKESNRNLIAIADAFENVDNSESDPLLFDLGRYEPAFQMLGKPLDLHQILHLVGTIQIDTEEVRNIAEQCKTVSSSVSEKAAAFADSVNKLSDTWEGNSHDKYVESAGAITKAFTGVEDSFSDFINRIITAANRYEEIDNSF